MARINPALCETNKLLLILDNFKVTAEESVKLWGIMEEAFPAFIGVGAVNIALLLTEGSRLWEARDLFLWAMRAAEGSAGTSARARADQQGGRGNAGEVVTSRLVA